MKDAINNLVSGKTKMIWIETPTNPMLKLVDLSFISSSIVSGLIPTPNTNVNANTGSRYYLNLYDAHPTELATSQVLYTYPVSGSWTMGDGHTYDNPLIIKNTIEKQKIRAENRNIYCS